ncbi:MAG: radical SAM protein [Elusimicrobia bacterium]|nr:radical SAM protein [Elusimicrobiota bacterium]
MSGDLEAAGRVGRFNRLKEHFPFALFRAGQSPPSGRHILYVLPADVSSFRVRLRGMRVLLVRGPCLPPSPYRLDELLAMPPLSLILLSGMLRVHGAEVAIRDLCLSRRKWRDAGSDPCARPVSAVEWKNHLIGRPSPRLRSLLGWLTGELKLGKAGMVAFSVESQDDLRLGLSLSRELAGRVPVVIGGREVRLDDPLIAACPEARIIAGEGEAPLLLYADALGGGRALSEVPGLNWTEGGLRRSQSSVIHDLDVWPAFDLAGVPLRDYRSDILAEGSGPLVPYQFNRGCPFLCGFCNSFSRREFRLRSPAKVVADLRDAVRQGVRRFYFVNHLLNGSPSHLRELVERLEAARLGIFWGDCCRTAGLDEAMLRRLRSVGASQLVWGVDCASPALARRMKKSSDPVRAPAILAAAHRAGIRNVVNLIIGMPRETERDVEETLRFIRRVRPFVDSFNVSPYGFDRNCPLARDPGAYGLRPGTPEPLPVPDPERTARSLARVEAAARG